MTMVPFRFQPTLLAVTRSDHAHVGQRHRASVSTHAPRGHEERLRVRWRCFVRIWFQPTLLAVTRSDRPGTTSSTRTKSFNPRSSRSRGATEPPSPQLRRIAVSTHAPRGHEERRRTPTTGTLPGTRFNPRSSRSRGATGPPPAPTARRRFNPRSSRSRGATTTTVSRFDSASWFQPTLLAVTRSDENGVFLAGLDVFQPTLLAVTRSDNRALQMLKLASQFQPTLLAVTRSDFNSRSRWARSGVSTHAPRGHEERPRWGVPWGACGVSTHAPRGHEERPAEQQDVLVHGRVSTHAPRGHEERLVCLLLSARPRFVSTHAPRGHEERHSDYVCSKLGTRVSTHAPRGHEERPGCASGPPGARPVSTHAPRGHEERLTFHGFGLTDIRFQPTLLAVTRSDDPGREGRARWPPVSTHAPRGHEERRFGALAARRLGGFNPRSSRSRGATRPLTGGRASKRCFNPRSSRSRGATSSRLRTSQISSFQPTLLAVTRSDLVQTTTWLPPMVSTHAPRGHEERPHPVTRGVTMFGFNPRSSRSRGATGAR